MQLSGQRALITGASRGFGRAVAEAFTAAGARVVCCARQPSDSTTVRADVTDPLQVNSLVRTTLGQLGGLDAVVCNAGVYGPKGPVEQVDLAEWSAALATNLMGVVHVCREVLPHFKRQRRGKIIVLSGGGATKPMPFLSAYAASKAAVVRFAETLAEEVRVAGIMVNCVAPGAMNTRMLDEVLAAGPDKVGRAFYDQAVRQKQEGGVAPARGADLCVFLASPASDGITGRLISAVWDRWETLPAHRAELAATDIYTLRRIVPQDRGKEWE